MKSCRHQIQALAYAVSEGLIDYVIVHDKIFNEAATFKSLLNNIFGRGVPMLQLLQDAEGLIPIWNDIVARVTFFGRDEYSSMNEDEKRYFEILNRYAHAVNETVAALIERQKLLNVRSKGGRNNPVTWSVYQKAEKSYQAAIQNYLTIGQELTEASYLVF